MTKIILNYDPVSGQITDNNNIVVGTYVGVLADPYEDTKTNKNSLVVEDITAMKEKGFSVDEIIKLNREGII